VDTGNWTLDTGHLTLDCNQLNLSVQYISSVLRYSCSVVCSCVDVDVNCVGRLRIVSAVDSSIVLSYYCCSACVTSLCTCGTSACISAP